MISKNNFKDLKFAINVTTYMNEYNIPTNLQMTFHVCVNHLVQAVQNSNTVCKWKTYTKAVL